MTCEEAKRRDLAELYARGELAPEEAAAYEEHYWGCVNCLEEVEAIQVARIALSRAAHSRAMAPGWKWAAAAALVASLGGGAFWAMQKGGEPKLAHSPVPRQQAVANVYATLARLETPPYQALRMRSSSPAKAALQSAMGPYVEGRPSDSIAGLRRVVAQHPDFATARFYLGASLLRAGDGAGAGQEFQRLIALGDGVYLEDSLYLLAQAELLAAKPDEARKHLYRAVALAGARRAAALQILEKLDQIDKPAVH